MSDEDPRVKWERFSKTIKNTDAYPLWVEWMAFYVQYHSTILRLMRGDVETLLVYFGVIFASQRGEGKSLSRLKGSRDYARGYISGTALADMLNMSRETTRRKLKALESRQLVKKHPLGGWTFDDRTSDLTIGWGQECLPIILNFLVRMERLRDATLKKEGEGE